jgi:hypothetical protein
LYAFFDIYAFLFCIALMPCKERKIYIHVIVFPYCKALMPCKDGEENDKIHLPLNKKITHWKNMGELHRKPKRYRKIWGQNNMPIEFILASHPSMIPNSSAQYIPHPFYIPPQILSSTQ